MTKNIPSYIIMLSCGNISKLEEIIGNKYFELLDFYWLLKEYSDNIDNLDYIESEDDLIIDIKFSSGIKIASVYKELILNIPDGKRIDIEKKKHSLLVTCHH